MKPWINTFTGKRFDLLTSQPGDVCIEDIFHALSHINRFTGHTRRPYSVAEHSCRVFDIVEAYDYGPDALRWALMHDASEAYLGDVSAPLKSLLPAYRELEAAVTERINRHFGIDGPMPMIVKDADMQMLALEVEELLPNKHRDFELPAVSPKARRAMDRMYGGHYFGCDPVQAAFSFRARYNKVFL